MAQSIRLPAVSGLFYPSEVDELQVVIKQCFNSVDEVLHGNRKGGYFALIAPHAGYPYSGRVAAAAYCQLPSIQTGKIALLGPSHRVPLRGVAAPSHQSFLTPLGEIPLDRGVINNLIDSSLVQISDAAHALEHSIEVHLPFLQYYLSGFDLVPLVVGDARPEVVAEIIDELIKQDFFIIISSDLSHFLPYREAVSTDKQTSEKIIRKDWHLSGEDACGCRAINGLLKYAAGHECSVELIAQENSGDLAGDKSRVVGYGAYGVARSGNVQNV